MIFHFINNFVNQISWNTYSKTQAEIIKIFADRATDEKEEKYSNYYVLKTLIEFFKEKDLNIISELDSELENEYEYSKLLLIIFYDIINNSLKYSNGKITIKAKKEKRKLSVNVRNTTPISRHKEDPNRNNVISKSLLELLDIGEIDYYKENKIFYSILRLG